MPRSSTHCAKMKNVMLGQSWKARYCVLIVLSCDSELKIA